ncbi:desulfoferrodoxin ferrous iron-binding domain [Campylobacter sputorum subsp. bubulus]|uniref:Desulfoferrodoxin ferrous iron-binding domain n=1 Tax=Campylobacter sputorum subsp. sputorum TaxID=32024 RepID=A0A381DIZ9_9BACT|nr:desulfoferrodoxin family protein [Campylobacter sputorum]ASM35502.1 desulfoferrodoxin [Campylobacter sputorum aubsp. sputorum RM3237]ASM37217.1 desulfoferrodoxin [Campylobacter sputorum bv. faecalis CCUG 20703]ASM38883.1 desulfoferrodoxin [Campylobacter sputorum bv. paraureolyticus LMG 11764]KAB0582763.1 twin-arginine translocation pathway signal protein [Campylobacter sputorum subsp. sputorum]MDY6121122.1 desulfoferrodoxin family protein [Campylobacter sputorum]
MKRRDALKVIALSGVAVSIAGAYDKALIVNKEDMKLQDPKNPNEFEYKHLPEISIKDKDKKGYTLIEITVGQKDIIHPSDADHWIYKIELYADDKLVGYTELEPVISRGYYSTRVKLDGVKELKSTACCNLHGNYTATKIL